MVNPKEPADLPVAGGSRTTESTQRFRSVLRNVLPRGADAEAPLIGTEALLARARHYGHELEWADEDGARIRELHSRVAKSDLEQVVDSLLTEDVLASKISGETDFDRLGFSLREFFSWFGTFDPASDECVRRRVDYYLRHRVLGVHPDWYALAYEAYLQLLSRCAQAAARSHHQDEVLWFSSIHRLVLYDLGIVHQVYFATRRSRAGAGAEFLLPSRRRKDFISRIDEQIKGKHGSKPRGATVMVIGVENLHQINTVMGHRIGDLVMQHVASRLGEALRRSDYLQRTGAAEYGLLMPGVDEHAIVTLAAKKFSAALAEPLRVGGRELHLKVAFGVASMPRHGREGATVFQHAELAMREAVRTQADYLFFNPGLKERSRTLYSLETELRKAIADNEEFQLHYQPQLDLATGRVVGVEALMRWESRRYGRVPPGKFIPIAESSGLIHRVSVWVLQNALREFSDSWAAGTDYTVSVNISALNLLDPELPDLVLRMLRTWDAEPSRLMLEITESAMMANPRAALKSLERLHEIGVRLSIDDFGTGHSSLIYLKRLPVEELKIDRSFVCNMLHDAGDKQIVRTVIDLAHNFGLEVLAEGVEDTDTAEQLKAWGCERVQGYLVSAALPYSELTGFLQRYHGADR